MLFAMLSTEVFLLLTETRGWDLPTYQSWVVRMIRTVLEPRGSPLMATDLSGPADTSMMRIVHSALRRDIARAQAVLSDLPYPDEPQRVALSSHLRWMIGWLHHHHETEDAYLYPMVREARPDVAACSTTWTAITRRSSPP